MVSGIYCKVFYFWGDCESFFVVGLLSYVCDVFSLLFVSVDMIELVDGLNVWVRMRLNVSCVGNVLVRMF